MSTSNPANDFFSKVNSLIGPQVKAAVANPLLNALDSIVLNPTIPNVVAQGPLLVAAEIAAGPMVESQAIAAAASTLAAQIRAALAAQTAAPGAPAAPTATTLVPGAIK